MNMKPYQNLELITRAIVFSAVIGLTGCATSTHNEADASAKSSASSKPIKLSVEEKAELAKPADGGKSAVGAPRDYSADWMPLEKWYDLHKEDVAIAEKGEASIVFVGDSITQGWPQDLLDEAFGPGETANFGIGGDLTENLVWRLENGAIGSLKPDVVVQLIGINNFWDAPSAPAFIMNGIKRNTEILVDAYPDAEIMLLALLPADLDRLRDRSLIDKLNQMIETYAGLRANTHFRDHGQVFLDANTQIKKNLMPDSLHPNRNGYEQWIQPMREDVLELKNRS